MSRQGRKEGAQLMLLQRAFYYLRWNPWQTEQQTTCRCGPAAAAAAETESSSAPATEVTAAFPDLSLPHKWRGRWRILLSQAGAATETMTLLAEERARAN